MNCDENYCDAFEWTNWFGDVFDTFSNWIKSNSWDVERNMIQCVLHSLCVANALLLISGW